MIRLKCFKSIESVPFDVIFSRLRQKHAADKRMRGGLRKPLMWCNE